MERRDFLSLFAAGVGSAPQGSSQTVAGGSPTDVVVERSATGKPHQSKVFALITPHLDDGPIFAGGTVAKLLREGYTGYFIRTSNDEKDSYKRTLGATVLANEQDTALFAKTIGLKEVFDLGYRNHRMDDVGRTEIRARLIFLFRLLRVDTVLSYDPWGHYEENPDHYVTAQAVEAACWMAGGGLDLPEHFAAGLKPHSVAEKYYFARGPQLVNRVVDISGVIDQKRAAIGACRTMIQHMVKDLNDSLAERTLRIPALTGDETKAADEFISVAFLARDRQIGSKHGLGYAEEFHYIGPDRSLDEYISRNAVPL
ncbi:MAG: PIG-L family deacetylase [Bryobacteraceae bacterium]